MRELKFRVWSEDQKTYNYQFPYNKLGQFYVSENGKVFSDFGNIVAPEVRQEAFVVEQYTGLKDKNGKEIYEGDIVRWCGGFYEIYFDIVQGWRGIDKRGSIPNGHTLYQMTINNVDKPNIVGNIHENKEFLNGHRED